MRDSFSSTYKIGRLTLSFFHNEIVVIYLGKKGVYIKNIKRLEHDMRKRMIISLSSIAVVAAVSFFIPSGESFDQSEDDVRKNQILESSKTDYKTPVPHQNLVIKKHVVKKGESLNKIAKDFGVSLDTICGSNNLKSYEFISEGTELKIPNKDGIIYKMPSGSRIVAVARTYNVSLEKIIAENNIKNADFIAKDTVLFIPDAKPRNIFQGFLWPTAGRFVTCGYGWRRDPFMGSREFHQGLDIRCDYDWVKASKYGQVTYIGWLGGYGNTVVIAHPGGWKTLYAHLSRIIVSVGQYVKQGQYIAKSGNTGRSTGAHLHFEILREGAHKNPYSFLAKRK